MRYLVKVFDAKGSKKITKSTPYLVTDAGDENTKGSLWFWLWQSKRHNVDISVHRLIAGIEKTNHWDQILIIDQEGKLILEYASNLKLAELSRDSSVETYILQCVLDLS